MKTIGASFLLLIASAGWATSTPTIVSAAYNPATDHTYFLLSTSDWLSAESAAVSLGGNLVTINNQAENDWLCNQWGHTRTLLIDLTDAGHEGIFQWASGEAFGFSNWSSGEPNNGVGWGQEPENYVYMYADGWGTPGTWNDYSGSSDVSQAPIFGVVEVPEPSAGSLLWIAGIVLCNRLRKHTSK